MGTARPAAGGNQPFLLEREAFGFCPFACSLIVAAADKTQTSCTVDPGTVIKAHLTDAAFVIGQIDTFEPAP